MIYDDYNSKVDAAIIAAIGDRQCTSHWISGDRKVRRLQGNADRGVIRKFVQARLQSLRKRGKVERNRHAWKIAP